MLRFKSNYNRVKVSLLQLQGPRFDSVLFMHDLVAASYIVHISSSFFLILPSISFHCEGEGEGKGKGKVLSVLNYHYATKTYWGSEGITPCIFNLGTRWR